MGVSGWTGARLVRLACAAALLALMPAAAAAQPAAGQDAPASGWQDGFVLRSATGDFRLQFGLLVHADGRFAPADEDQVFDTFLVRRLRPYLRGRIAQRFEFYVNPDFGGGTVVVQDAYFDTVFSPAFRIRAGKTKHPFGFERFHASANMYFYERALPTGVAPNRDIGFQVLGDIAGGTFSYIAGVMNGVTDGASADADANDGKDVVGRIFVRPFTKRETSRLRGLSLGLSGSAGQQADSALPTFRTSSLQQPFFRYTGATGDGVRTRYSPYAGYTYKQFAAVAEYVRSRGAIEKDGAREDIAHQAWQVGALWVITGEAATDGSAPLRPKRPVDFTNGHWGALQIAARYHALAVDERAITLNFAPGSSRKADAWTVGLNWYLTQNVRYVVNFERTVFDDDAEGARKAENALAFRTQLYF